MAACLPGWLGAGDWWLGTGLAGGLGLGWLAGAGAGAGLGGLGGRGLQPSPAVSSLKDATLVPVKIVNCQLSIGFASIGFQI